jgi:glycosyltransferase involved in cell wall biosynthesis
MGVEDEFRPEGPLELPAPVEQILAGRTPNVLHVGAMTVRKRIDLLLRTFAVIQRSFPKAMLVRVGGSLSPEMRSLARELGVEPAIGTLPFLSRGQLAAVFRRADLFLFTSDREGFGLPVLEAMASGLPVVSRAIPAVQEVAGDSIWSVRGADHEALGEAAITLLKSPDTRTSLRQRGIERAAAFRWEHTARRTARVYEDVLAAL